MKVFTDDSETINSTNYIRGPSIHIKRTITDSRVNHNMIQLPILLFNIGK